MAVMGFYDRHLLPRIIHLVCRSKVTMRQREALVPRVRGRVLEVGIGSGLNLPFYDSGKVSELLGLDPSRALWRLAPADREALGFPLRFVQGSAGAIPLADESVDSILVTYSLCSIPDTLGALVEMQRVLRPGGELFFCEHGVAPDETVRRWQARLNPAWTRFGGGCRLDRAVPELIERGGFEIRELQARYLPGPRFASFNYSGRAVGRAHVASAPG
jgi:ubiquinone/menaquinone biosynthesis C-methylase UbiE